MIRETAFDFGPEDPESLGDFFRTASGGDDLIHLSLEVKFIPETREDGVDFANCSLKQVDLVEEDRPHHVVYHSLRRQIHYTYTLALSEPVNAANPLLEP